MRLIAVLAVLSLIGCTPITRQSTAEQPTSTELRAGVGDVMLRIEKTKCLPNAFGKCDIFGRTTSEGFIELRFAGIERSGEVVLARKDVEILSNESTMTRTPVAYSTGQAQAVTSGSSTRVTGQAMTISPLPDYHVVVPSDAIAIRLPPAERTLLIAGRTVEILEASAGTIRYKITGP